MKICESHICIRKITQIYDNNFTKKFSIKNQEHLTLNISFDLKKNKFL